MLQHLVHYSIHFIVPILVAYLWYKPQFMRVALILLCGIVIDVDHLLATPIFDSSRCSIGFHALHSYIAIGIYCILFIIKKTRIFGLALLIHILADTVDCLLM